MESKFLSSLGKVAGLGGIAFGVLLLVFQGVLQKQFLPQAGLASEQAYAVILALIIVTFGIAAIGVIAWLMSRTAGPKTPVPGPAMVMLAALVVLVLGAAVYVAAQATPRSQTIPKVEAKDGGVAIGGNVSGSTISTVPPTGTDRAPK